MNKKYSFFFCFLLFFSACCHANTQRIPKIAIIIDDLGNRYYQDERAVHLPGPVVCSILPYTPLAKHLAAQAHALHKEVILHTPMQAITLHRLGLGGLYITQDQSELETTLSHDLQAVPYIDGINNHMGSLLTQSPRAMNWVMETIKPRHLFFIDSVTSGKSVAAKMAKKDGIPTASRDVFLDDVPTPEAVRAQFQQLLWIAKHHGSAIAIGHPYPATMEVLEEVLPTLAAEGYQLVPVSTLLTKPTHIDLVMKKLSPFKAHKLTWLEQLQIMANEFYYYIRHQFITWLNYFHKHTNL